MTTPLRVRMAPSPTGDLHIGGLRTAIYDYLLAKQTGGTYILRIEDTDQSRFVEGATERLVEALHWAGIPPQEGVTLDDQGSLTEVGEYGPYTQSKRLPIYREHADQLLGAGKAYRCFCTAERLDEMRRAQQEQGEIPRYDGRCRNLPKEESEVRAAAGEAHVIRHAMPAEGEISFDDAVRGTITYNFKDIEDYVLMKSDGFPTYQLANVVDDHLMKIDVVLRGEEWIPSTPKNLALYEAFGWQPPRFAHLPVILGPDGKKKLSKRDGDVSVLSYRDRGYLPEALVNFLAFLGWSPGTEEEFLSLGQLAEKFRLEKVQKAAASCSFDRLEYVNGWYIRQLPVDALVERMVPWLRQAGLVEAMADADVPGMDWPVNELKVDKNVNDYLRLVATSIQERLKRFDEIPSLTWFFFKRPEVTAEYKNLLVPKKGDLETTLGILTEVAETLRGYAGAWEHDALKDFLMPWIAERGYKNGDVLWPVRASLSGEPASPGAFEMLAVLGPDESLERLAAVQV